MTPHCEDFASQKGQQLTDENRTQMVPLPLLHSPRPKSALQTQLPPPTPAGNSVPAVIGGKCPASSRSRASPLRVPPPWVIIGNCFWDPGHRPVAGPSRGPRCLQDPIGCTDSPGSFLVWCLDPHLVPIAMGLLCLAAAFSEGHGGRECRGHICLDIARRSRNGPGKSAGTSPCWISTGTSISNG
jgi:hypothetical protein